MPRLPGGPGFWSSFRFRHHRVCDGPFPTPGVGQSIGSSIQNPFSRLQTPRPLSASTVICHSRMLLAGILKFVDPRQKISGMTTLIKGECSMRSISIFFVFLFCFCFAAHVARADMNQAMLQSIQDNMKELQHSVQSLKMTVDSQNEVIRRQSIQIAGLEKSRE